MSRAIKLMADYHCSPIWEPGADAYNVSLDVLLLPPELRAALRAWADAYDRTLNQDYPPDSGFADAAAEEAFEVEGRRLWQALREALGAGFTVSYYSERDGLQEE